MNKLKTNKGITLIALVITIIVLLILAAVTLNMVIGDNGLFKKANDAETATNQSQAEEDVQLKLIEAQAANNGTFTYENLMDVLSKSSDTYVVRTTAKTATLIAGEDGTGITDIKGLNSHSGSIYITNTRYNVEVEVKENLEVAAKGKTNETTPTTPTSPTAGKTASTGTRTLSGATTGYSYKNPVIPKGFSAIDDGASWTYTDDTKTEVTGWNNGLVISDGTNEFVWVPVDGTTVKYERVTNFDSNDDASASSCSDATEDSTTEPGDGVTYKAIPVSDETAQITKYGGFYVARYESGLQTNTTTHTKDENNVYTSTPVSKKGSKIWNYIDYTHSYVAADKMVNNSDVKSGLITGKQYDTVMTWYKTSGIGVEKTTQNWGTYRTQTYNIPSGGLYFTYGSSKGDWQTATEKITHTGSTNSISATNLAYYHASGLNTDNGYQKNIADLGGNAWEWTAEVYTSGASSNRVYRGGVAHFGASDCPAAYRGYDSTADTYSFLGFRAVLYIQ